MAGLAGPIPPETACQPFCIQDIFSKPQDARGKLYAAQPMLGIRLGAGVDYSGVFDTDENQVGDYRLTALFAVVGIPDGFKPI
ncbi:MAG: hypothetical protein V3R83_09945 [Gammaproteobacteria bacterium]